MVRSMSQGGICEHHLPNASAKVLLNFGKVRENFPNFVPFCIFFWGGYAQKKDTPKDVL